MFLCRNSTDVVGWFWNVGIMFQDITTLLLDHKAFKDTVDIFVERYRDMDISVVAGTFFLDFCILSAYLKHLHFIWSVISIRLILFLLCSQQEKVGV